MIDINTLYTSCAQELGNGMSNQRLVAQFPICLNRAINQLLIESDSDSLPQVTGVTGTLNIPERYEFVLYSGVVYYLVRAGHSNSDPKIATIQYQDTEKRWKDGIALYTMDLINIDQKDPDNSIIAWGNTSSDNNP